MGAGLLIFPGVWLGVVQGHILALQLRGMWITHVDQEHCSSADLSNIRFVLLMSALPGARKEPPARR